MVEHLEAFELLLPPLDLVLELRQRCGELLATLDVLLQPLRVRLVLRERGDKVLARHAGIAHGDDHDLFLELADLGDMRAQVQNERVEHARRQLELHELIGQLRPHFQCFRVLRTGLLDRGQNRYVVFRDRRETGRGLLRIRTGIDDFLFAVRAVLTLFGFVVRLFLGLDELHFRGILGLGDDVGGVRVDEADNDVDQARLSRLYRLVRPLDEVVGGRVHGERAAHGIETFLDTLRDADFALTSQQLHRAHLAHVHADRIGSAAQLGIERSQRGGGFLDRLLVGGRRGLVLQQRLGIRCLLVHRDAHVVDRVDDVLDLLGIDDLGRQVIVHLGISEVTLLLTTGNQQLELGLAVFRHYRNTTLDT